MVVVTLEDAMSDRWNVVPGVRFSCDEEGCTADNRGLGEGDVTATGGARTRGPDQVDG